MQFSISSLSLSVKTGKRAFTLSFIPRFVGTFCGVFRRQALDRGAMALKVDKIVTGGYMCGNIFCKNFTRLPQPEFIF